jgi:hypothetical protein
LDCWDQNAIANFSFATTYDRLSSSRKTLVDNSFFNIMSYHIGIDRFTPEQLDRMADYSNGSRNNIATGHTRFVDRANTCNGANGSSKCNIFGGPFPSVEEGVAAAASGDIVLMRPGHYNETLTLTKRVILRATRGNAVIGIP